LLEEMGGPREVTSVAVDVMRGGEYCRCAIAGDD